MGLSHTDHCVARMKWGDGECECGADPITKLVDRLMIANRIAIAGGPKTGKTTLADRIANRDPSFHIIHTDDLINKVEWGGVPDEIARQTVGRKRFIVEGVQAGRCLRKHLAVDLVVWLERPHVELDFGQRTMWRGCRTIFSDWLGMLESKAIPIVRPW